MDNYSWLRTMRDASSVTRAHTCRRLVNRTVGDHSHGITMVLIGLNLFSTQKFLNDRLLTAAAVHDLSELETGDVPAPAKWMYPGLKKELNVVTTGWEESFDIRVPLSAEEAELLSWADMVEFAMYAIEEVTLGNQFFKVYLANAVRNLRIRRVPTLCPGAAEELLNDIVTEVTSLCGKDIAHGGK